MSALFLIGCFVAFVACLIARAQERREGAAHEAPILLTGAMLLLVFAQTVLHANEMVHPCSTIDPNESWLTWAMWVANGCFYQ